MRQQLEEIRYQSRILYILKKQIHLHGFLQWRLFYQPSWRYLAELGMEVKTQNMRGKFKSSFMQKLREIIILMGKRFAGNCVVIFALFFETSMPKIYNLLKI